MAGERQKSDMVCAEFDALLSDALDRILTGAKLQNFQAHAASCAVCGPLLKDAEAGRSSLKLLEEVEPPVNLVSNILVATTGLQTNRFGAVVPSRLSWWEQFSATIMSPVLGAVRQPRFVMSFGMAFFAASMCLSLAGVKLTDLRRADLRPSTIKRNYYETSGRVVKYYENMRFVYEMESRLREFKQVTAPAEPAQDQDQNEDKSKEHRNDTSSRPDQKENRNYSRGETNAVLAGSTAPALASSDEQSNDPAKDPRRAL
jgi:Putative zinc-finger